jgi:hypothetical protein
MRPLLIIALFFLPFVASAQRAAVKDMTEVNPKFSNNKYVFPVITVGTNKKVTDKINHSLRADYLQIDSPKIKKSIFENVWSTEASHVAKISDISYEVLCNDNYLLSFSISAEGCSTYCENYTTYYSYDLKTGNRIHLDTLLSANGQKWFLQNLNSYKKKLITEKIAAIKDTLQNPSIRTRTDDKAYYEGMKYLYETCVNQPEITDLRSVKFYLSQKTLFVSLDRCSNHFNKNLDELDNFEFRFKIENLKQYLSPYAAGLVKE